MKAKRAHRVPLRARAVEVLREAERLHGAWNETGDEELVFPTVRGKALDAATISKLVRDLGIAAAPHGFRSSFRDWAAEKTDHPREVIEAALAHVVQNQVEAAYARSDLFERRRTLMNDWEAYIADTHPHRPAVEPAEDELAGTAAHSDEIDHPFRRKPISRSDGNRSDPASSGRPNRPPTSQSGGDHIGTDRAGKNIEQDDGHDKIPESDAGDQGGEEQETGGTIRRNENWLLTAAICQEQHTPFATHGLARGSAPSTPRTTIRRVPRRFRPAVDATVAGPRAGRIMSVGDSRRSAAHHRRALPDGSRADHPLCGQLRRPGAADDRPRNPNRLA